VLQLLVCVLWAVLALAAADVSHETAASLGDRETPRPGRIVEIRVYTLKPGARQRFHDIVAREAVPLLRRWNIDTVAYGPSRHDEVSYFLVRAFRDLADRMKIEDAFYGSAEWKNGPRTAILSAIDHYSTVVVHLDDETVRALRDSLSTEGPGGGS
jgi:hypothetical protein